MNQQRTQSNQVIDMGESNTISSGSSRCSTSLVYKIFAGLSALGLVGIIGTINVDNTKTVPFVSMKQLLSFELVDDNRPLERRRRHTIHTRAHRDPHSSVSSKTAETIQDPLDPQIHKFNQDRAMYKFLIEGYGNDIAELESRVNEMRDASLDASLPTEYTQNEIKQAKTYIASFMDQIIRLKERIREVDALEAYLKEQTVGKFLQELRALKIKQQDWSHEILNLQLEHDHDKFKIATLESLQKAAKQFIAIQSKQLRDQKIDLDVEPDPMVASQHVLIVDYEINGIKDRLWTRMEHLIDLQKTLDTQDIVEEEKKAHRSQIELIREEIDQDVNQIKQIRMRPIIDNQPVAIASKYRARSFTYAPDYRG